MLIIKPGECIKSCLFLMFLAPEFTPDSTYVYSYVAKIMGGLPEEGLARAGIKIRSKVFIRKEKDIILMKVNDLPNH